MDDAKNTIALLILAAGSSSRMGTPKQLLPWGNTTLLGNAIHNAKTTGITDIYVVVGANASQILETAHTDGIQIIKNPLWKQGLGTSIAMGIRHFNAKAKDYNGVLVMLCDQPLVDSDYLNQMIISFQTEEKSIIATAYDKRIGVPALFNNTYFEALAKLNMDYGAKEILKANKHMLKALNPLGKAIDVDTMAEYEKLKTSVFGKN